ncbi:sigma-70 family RNA polymerase sigma factor [Citricoccus nitrophenolicus]|uniref:RNA polymerase sigma factor n=1 Tax=Citricoccus nitrophenolicus TaxID=863575 RepID=UPI0031EF355A
MREPFEQAVQRHGSTVLKVCRAVLGPGPDADDAWQETFLAALREWPDLDPLMPLEPWLVRVAGRKAIDVVRVRNRQALPVGELPERLNGAGPAAVEGAGHGVEVWAAVAALPERQRLAVAYHYLGGLPHADTAAVIGGSAESVRRASSDGIRALRRLWTDERTGAG